jgi:hypothetical protein
LPPRASWLSLRNFSYAPNSMRARRSGLGTRQARALQIVGTILDVRAKLLV